MRHCSFPKGLHDLYKTFVSAKPLRTKIAQFACIITDKSREIQSDIW